MNWVGHAARMWDIGSAYKILVEKPEGKRLLERIRYRWGIILKCILNKEGVMVWIGFIWLRVSTNGGLL
jgi:hypothetical protein